MELHVYKEGQHSFQHTGMISTTSRSSKQNVNADASSRLSCKEVGNGFQLNEEPEKVNKLQEARLPVYAKMLPEETSRDARYVLWVAR